MKFLRNTVISFLAMFIYYPAVCYSLDFLSETKMNNFLALAIVTVISNTLLFGVGYFLSSPSGKWGEPIGSAVTGGAFTWLIAVLLKSFTSIKILDVYLIAAQYLDFFVIMAPKSEQLTPIIYVLACVSFVLPYIILSLGMITKRNHES